MSYLINCNFYFVCTAVVVFHTVRMLYKLATNHCRQMVKFANAEQATVSYEHSKIVAPGYWCDDLVAIDTTSIARLQRMMANHGCEVIGDTSPALATVMGVHRSNGEPTIQVTNDIPTEKRWKRRVVLDPEDVAWEAQFDIKSDHVITPETGVDTGMKVNFSHTPPELTVFAELPQASAIMAAGRLATRQIDVGQSPAPYLEQVERWWGMPKGLLSDVFNQSSLPISIPRLLAAGGKSASPLYGIENLSGLVRFVEPSATRESFKTKADTAVGAEVAVDFSYYRAAVRWVFSNAMLIPGPAKEQLIRSKGIIGFDISLQGRVVIPNKALAFAIPELQFEVPTQDLKITKETQKAIGNAQRGRLAVIAGVALKDGEMLLSDVTRARMGRIRAGTFQTTRVSGEVKIRIRDPGVYHAEAGVGLSDYCINMLGANGDHMLRNSAVLGRISAILEQHDLSASKQHSSLVALLWDPTFKSSFQHMCRNNSTTMDDFIATAPEDYHYDAKIAYMLLRNRMRTVIGRLKGLESCFSKEAAEHSRIGATVNDVARCVERWASYYAGKAAALDKGWRRVRAQVLASFYACVMVDGDQIAFPELKAFLEDTVSRYARRKKLMQLDFSALATAEDVAAAADTEYEPEYHFQRMLASLQQMSKWTITDLMDREDDMPSYDQLEIEDTMEPVMSDEALLSLADLPDLDFIESLVADEKYDVNKMTGPLAMRAKYYAHLLMSGKESEFIKRFCKANFESFEDWAKADPAAYLVHFDELIKDYIKYLDRKIEEDPEDGEADVL